MLTPAKIKNHEFENSGRNAYKAESVDSFFAEVVVSYEQMFRENGEMYKKIGLLAERLEEYRKDENNIREALLTAQRMADSITRDAQEKADRLLAETEERVKTENDRIDAISNDMLQKANYQAQAIVSDAQHQAEQMLENATVSSKEAAVSARDSMIKEEAALQMMKVEVTKFKKQILDAYNEQLALIEQLPEIVYAKIEEEQAEAKTEEEAVEETAEETEETEEIVEETEEALPSDFNFTISEESADIEDFQEITVVTEETHIQDDEAEEETEEKIVENERSYILPDIDAIDEKIERRSREIAEREKIEESEDDNEYDDEDDIIPDIPISKRSSKKNENGFKVNFENVSVYDDEDDDDEYDDDDDDDDEFDDDDDFKSKRKSRFKGFFRKK